MNIKRYLERLKVVNKLIETGEWKSEKVRKLVNAVFGSEKSCERFLMRATQEELDQILEAEGIDPKEVVKRLAERIANIQKQIG